MVSALPGAPDGNVETQAPQQSLDGVGAITGALKGLGDQLDQIGTNLSVDQAKDDGANAVSRDPATGILNFTPHAEIFPWDKAYNDAGQASYQAQSDGDQRLGIQQIFLDNKADPQAAKVAAEGWLKGYGEKADPALRPWINDHGTQLISQFMLGAVSQKNEANVATTNTTLATSYTTAENDFLALAYQHGSHTPEAQAAYQRMVAVTAQMKNPVLGNNAAKVDKMLAESGTMAEAQAALGHVVTIGKAQGVQAGLQASQDTFADPALNLSPAQREHYQSVADTNIRQWHAAAQESDLEAQRQLSYHLDDALAGANTGKDWTTMVTPKSIMDAYPNDPSRAAAIIGRLDAAAQTYGDRKIVSNSTPAQLGQFLASLDPRNAPAAAPAQNAIDLIPGLERSGDAAVSPKGAVGRYQIEPGTARQYGFDPAKLTDPAYSKTVATAITGDLSKRYGGDQQAVLVAYNAGPGVADKWLAAGKDNSLLPQETQDYLARAGEAQPTGGYAQAVTRFQSAIQAVTERQTAIKNDSAGYVAGIRPDIGQMLSANDAPTVQNGVRASLQVQSDLGTTSPRILSKPQIGSIVAAFSNPQDPTRPADSMNGVIDGLAAKYGQYFPQVMKELQARGMPPEASSLYLVRGEGGVSYRMAQAINSMSQMGKDLNAGRDAFFANSPNNAEIRKAIPTSGLADYAASFQGNPGGPVQVAAMTNAVNLYARQLSYEGVSDPSAAAQQAYKDLIGSRYHFVDSYRVPVGVDDSLVSAGANAIRSNLDAATLEPHGNPVPGVTTEQRQKTTETILRSKGVWVTRSDEKGLYLAWPGETGFTPAITSGGKQITFSWAQLQGAGNRVKPSVTDAQQSGLEAGAGN